MRLKLYGRLTKNVSLNIARFTRKMHGNDTILENGCLTLPAMTNLTMMFDRTLACIIKVELYTRKRFGHRINHPFCLAVGTNGCIRPWRRQEKQRRIHILCWVVCRRIYKLPRCLACNLDRLAPMMRLRFPVRIISIPPSIWSAGRLLWFLANRSRTTVPHCLFSNHWKIWKLLTLAITLTCNLRIKSAAFRLAAPPGKDWSLKLRPCSLIQHGLCW